LSDFKEVFTAWHVEDFKLFAQSAGELALYNPIAFGLFSIFETLDTGSGREKFTGLLA